MSALTDLLSGLGVPPGRAREMQSKARALAEDVLGADLTEQLFTGARPAPHDDSRLVTLRELHRDGVLTDAEYASACSRITGDSEPGRPVTSGALAAELQKMSGGLVMFVLDESGNDVPVTGILLHDGGSDGKLRITVQRRRAA